MAGELNLTLTINNCDQVLEVRRLEGEEAISELFWFELTLAADGPLDAAVAPGKSASLEMRRDGELVRVVHGMLESVGIKLQSAGAKPHYRARLVPRMARGRLVRQQRIFMDVSIIDVAKEKLNKVALHDADVAVNTVGDYPQREFIVQYQEDDTDFISRLSEHAGLAFYFDHDQGHDRIVFVDHKNGFATNDACPPLQLTEDVNDVNRLSWITRDRNVAPGLAMAYDYNYRTPELALRGMTKLATGNGGGVLEYPCHVKTTQEATALATLRTEEFAVHQNPYAAGCAIPLISAGLRVEFEGSEHLPAASLLVTKVKHSAQPIDGTSLALVYTNTFEAVDATLQFRPRRVTPRPRISGIVTGIVQGVNDSDTVATQAHKNAIIDEHGRYRVQFHFDQVLGNLSEKASRPVRMSQPFTGSSEGLHFPLKPGVEVAMAFMDGDPDRPIIIGALPNHTQPSVVTANNADVNKITTDNGITIQFGKASN